MIGQEVRYGDDVKMIRDVYGYENAKDIRVGPQNGGVGRVCWNDDEDGGSFTTVPTIGVRCLAVPGQMLRVYVSGYNGW